MFTEISGPLITLAWINLLIHMRQVPVLGKYITIFHDIFYTFIKFGVILLIFIIAFALGFHILNGNLDFFDSIHDSMLKVLIMMSGEFDYTSIFLEHGPVPFKFSSYFLFIVLFILLSIITLNLLIGLTVDDIKSFLDEADMKNLKLKVTFLTS